MMKKQPLYIKILIRLAFLIVPIAALYFFAVYNYNPHEHDAEGEHHHTMGPMFGFVIFSGLITVIWLLAMIVELIMRRFKEHKQTAFWLIFLVVMAAFGLLFFI